MAVTLPCLASLRFYEDGIQVQPPANMNLEPFQLPPLAKSLPDTLATAGMQFLAIHDRCLAFLLFHDCVHHQWLTGIPRQRAAPGAPSWQLRADELDRVSTHTLLLGSFQVLRPAPGERPIDHLPAFDGVHLLLDANVKPALLGCFVRAGGTPRAVQAEDMIADDADHLLDLAQSRVELL